MGRGSIKWWSRVSWEQQQWPQCLSIKKKNTLHIYSNKRTGALQFTSRKMDVLETKIIVLIYQIFAVLKPGCNLLPLKSMSIKLEYFRT